MRLISLYIENFGGLRQYSLSFEAGLTVLKEDNGFGKTTLAEFIRAMFYGFPRANKKLEKNLRKKYLPWQGGKYGGNLVFEHEGKRFRIERTFGETPKGDTFLLTDAATHQKSGDFTENIGLELFGLDSDSFERSTYMPQLPEGGSLTTTGIQAKLGNLVEDTNDINNYDKAVDALKKKRSSLVPYKGNSGAVAEASQRITAFLLEIENAEAQKQALSEVLAQLEGVRTALTAKSGEREAVREELTLASQYSAKAALEKQRAALEQTLSDCLRDSGDLSRRYPQGFPTPEELKQAESAALALTSLAPAPGEAEQLETLERFFAPGVPEEEALSRWSGLVRQLSGLKERRNALDPEPDRLRELEEFFGGSVPEEEALAEQQRKLDRAAGLRQENVRLSAQETEETAPARKKLTVAPFALVGLLAVLGGIVLLVFQQVPIGAALMGVGVLALALAFVLNQRQLERTLRASQSGVSPLRRETLLANERTAGALEGEVLRFTAAYPCAQSSLSDRLARIRSSREALLSLREKQAAREALETQAAAVTETLTEALAPYFGGSGAFEENLLTLRENRAAWLRLRETGSLREAEMARCRGILGALGEKYALPEALSGWSDVQRLREDASGAARLAQQAQSARRTLEEFRREHREVLALPERKDLRDPEALKAAEARLSRELREAEEQRASLEQRQRLLLEKIDRLPELEDELERWKEKKAADLDRSRLLDETVRFLQEAKSSLSDSYLGTLQQKFAEYMGRVTGADRESLFVSPELEVSMERLGEARPLACFSAGQTDTVLLCMRMALVDALFRDARPFVILDDPFANLDETHLPQALRLLTQLSETRQILYLTCHGTRTPLPEN